MYCRRMYNSVLLIPLPKDGINPRKNMSQLSLLSLDEVFLKLVIARIRPNLGLRINGGFWLGTFELSQGSIYADFIITTALAGLPKQSHLQLCCGSFLLL